MKEELSEMLDSLSLLRKEAFAKQNEPLYLALGKAMHGLIAAKDLVK